MATSGSSHVYGWGALLSYGALTLIASWRGELPEEGSPLAYLAVLLLFVFLGLGAVLDLLTDLTKRPPRPPPPAS